MWCVELWDGQEWFTMCECHTFKLAFEMVMEYRKEGRQSCWRHKRNAP